MQYGGRCVSKIKVDAVPYPSVERRGTAGHIIRCVVVARWDYIDQGAIGKVDSDRDIVQREPRRAVHDRISLVAVGLGGEPEENWAKGGTLRHQLVIGTVLYRLDAIRVHSARINVLLEGAASSRSRDNPVRVRVDSSKLAIGLRLNRSGIGLQGAI